MFAPGFTKKINILCLLTGIAIILALPLKKEIWYDETVSILCAKGLSHDSPSLFSNTATISSANINELNTAKNVFSATVTDNANSFLYNISLHWFTLICGNSITAYMLLSKLLAISTIIAFYFLCTLFFEYSIFTSIALLLLATDNGFVGMSHEIRAYAMGIFFATLAAIYFYKFTYKPGKPIYLFWTGLFAVCAILIHFLTVYIILVFLAAIIFTKRVALFSAKNILALLIPIALLVFFFCCAYPGLQTMSVQNQHILQKTMAAGFSLEEVFWRTLRFTAINFKAVFPSFWNSKPVIVISFLFVLSLYVAGIKAAANKEQKRNLHLLFLLGASSSLFLAFLCVKSHHYTALYYRYYSFCLPFCSLFIAYFLFVLYGNEKINKFIKSGLLTLIIIPALILFIAANKNTNPEIKDNHSYVAKEIVSDKIVTIDVPRWRDAFLLQAFLPAGYKIDYVRNPNDPNFVLHKENTVEKIPVIKDDQ